ncbi:MAG TPA: M20/M25/M40 family metallo-hydrolase [Edaphobacter sp.]|nr:M20/M25/M40 family metallo-hydrolase [Edaphobacter sp.]
MSTASTHRRISHLATLTAVHRAFHWLHLHQPQLRQWQLEIVRIPAPPFGEAARAAWFLDRFQQLGLTKIHQDEVGNVLAELAPESTSNALEKLPLPTPNSVLPVVLLSAHLDTVFPADTPLEPLEPKDSSRIHAPGICDNAAGLSGLLAIAAALRYANITPPIPILFAANVGEEGEGDLRGMRHLFECSPYRNRIAAAIALEGSGNSAVVTRALGSLRYRVTITGPGGHSWTDAGTLNPILILSRALTRIAALDLPTDPPTTINVGHISGGTSVNSIPESATALLDIRSTDPAQLTDTAATVHQIFEEVVITSAQKSVSPKLQIEAIGNRPAAALPDDSPLLQTLRAVDRHLTLRTELRLGSTDANIPLSQGVPAIAIGAGGAGGGIHTLQEWYDPTGRETALRRIVLTLLDTLQITERMKASIDDALDFENNI